MPYRLREFHELCTECKDRAERTCLRCGRPLCGLHAPAEGLRCIDCENQFDRSLRRNALISVGVGVLIWVTALALVTMAPGTRFWARLIVFLFVGGAPLMVGASMLGNKLLYAGKRQRFLAQRQPALLSSGAQSTLDSGLQGTDGAGANPASSARD